MAENESTEDLEQIEVDITASHQLAQERWVSWLEAMTHHRKQLEKRAAYLATERGQKFMQELRLRSRQVVEERRLIGNDPG